MITGKKEIQTHCHICGRELEDHEGKPFTYEFNGYVHRTKDPTIRGYYVIKTCPAWEILERFDFFLQMMVKIGSNGHYRRVWRVYEGQLWGDPPPILLCTGWSG